MPLGQGGAGSHGLYLWRKCKGNSMRCLFGKFAICKTFGDAGRRYVLITSLLLLDKHANTPKNSSIEAQASISVVCALEKVCYH